MAECLEKTWRCKRCGALLGVERCGRLHLKYKAAQFLVEGTVTAACHRCGELNVTATGTATSPVMVTAPAVVPAPSGRMQSQDARSER